MSVKFSLKSGAENSLVGALPDCLGRALGCRALHLLSIMSAEEFRTGTAAVVQLEELMMILDLHRQGLSVTAIARRTGRDPKTVRWNLAPSRAMLAQNTASEALGHGVLGNDAVDAGTTTGWAQKFPKAASFRINFSSVRSETARRSRGSPPWLLSTA